MGFRRPRSASIFLMISSLGIAGGCSVLKSALELPDKAIRSVRLFNEQDEAVDPVELQSQLIRFADNYLDAFYPAAGKLQESSQAAERRDLLQRRVAVTNDILAIATGANAYVSLLDMVILVTLNRMNVEDYWLPKRFGVSAQPLLIVHSDAEKEIWRIASIALKKNQIEELHASIRAWHEQHPQGRSPRDVGALGFASEVGRMNRNAQAGTGSVFGLLMIDPLSGLDPATRELANTRLLAERGLFLTRHMPRLISWETELLAIQAAEMPQVRDLLASTERLTDAADRFSRVSERLPAVISTERAHIVEALQAERPGLTSLAAQTEEALAAGKLMSEAADATLKTFQDVVKQLEASPSDPNSEPFRIRDYAVTATQLSTTAQNLVQLLQAFNQTIGPKNLDALSARVDLLNRQIEASGKDLVDYAFRKILILGVILITLACTLVLATRLLYWRLSRHSRGAAD